MKESDDPLDFWLERYAVIFAENRRGGWTTADVLYAIVQEARAPFMKDAARYRWLRERFMDETYGPGCFSEIFWWPCREEPPETLDAAIDAEIAKADMTPEGMDAEGATKFIAVGWYDRLHGRAHWEPGCEPAQGALLFRPEPYRGKP